MTTERSTKIVNFMTPGAGVFVLGRVPYKSYSENALFFLKSSFQLSGIDQTNQICSNDNQGRFYQSCKFHEPRGRGFCARAWPFKMYYLLLYQYTAHRLLLC